MILSALKKFQFCKKPTLTIAKIQSTIRHRLTLKETVVTMLTYGCWYMNPANVQIHGNSFKSSKLVKNGKATVATSDDGVSFCLLLSKTIQICQHNMETCSNVKSLFSSTVLKYCLFYIQF